MKDILTRAQQDFDRDLVRISFDSLKNLIQGIHHYLLKNGTKLYETTQGKEMIFDLERKQTKIIKELQRRGYLKGQNGIDFNNWLYRKIPK